MENDQLSDLINRGIVRTGTEVTIIRRGMDLGGSNKAKVEESLEVISHKEVDGVIILTARSVVDGKPYKIKANNIKKIDGMFLGRLINAHQTEGKKRGRKPKNKQG